MIIKETNIEYDWYWDCYLKTHLYCPDLLLYVYNGAVLKMRVDTPTGEFAGTMSIPDAKAYERVCAKLNDR